MLHLFYFNKKFIKPIVLIVVKVFGEEDLQFLEDNTDTIFQVLLENNLAEESDILIFDVNKQYILKNLKWILPSTKSDLEFVKKLEKKPFFIDELVNQTIKNSSCETHIMMMKEENNLRFQIKDCDFNLDFFL